MQFNVIFIIETSGLLNWVLGKKVTLLFNGATRRFIVCIHGVFFLLYSRRDATRNFIWPLQCHALKRYIPIDRKYIFFLAHYFINCVISQ